MSISALPLPRRRLLQAAGLSAPFLLAAGVGHSRYAIALEPAKAPASADKGLGVTRRLAEFVVNSRPADVPPAARREALRSILNYVGCAIGGSTHETVERALAALAVFSGPPQAGVLGRRERFDIFHAALFNGISSHVLDFDDTQLSTIIHPAGPVASALFPLAELRNLTGTDFLHAFILGVEVECRIGKSVYPAHYEAGWHITGTAGVFGAAAAAGKVLQLSSQQMTWALGIAATQSAGFKEMFGTMCKAFHPGRAAQNGLAAALLAAQNFTSSEHSIESERGFAHVMSPARDFSAMTRGLGTDWEISENTYKPFACGIVIHPVIDACRQLRQEHSLTGDQIQQIDLRVHPLVLSLTGKTAPATGLEGKFSVYHAAAVSLLRGAASPHEFTDQAVRDPAVIALRERVRATIDPELHEDQARVTIQLTTGRRLEKFIEHAVGSSRNPLSNRDLEGKFRALAAGILPPPQVDQVIELCWSLESSQDVGQIARAAVAAGGR
jgi:2-methylcitrate dehydratase PrpD